MKKFSFGLIFLMFFLVSCKDYIVEVDSGLYERMDKDEKTGIYVELIDKGSGKFIIGRVGDDNGVFNEKKVNTLFPKLQNDVDNLENFNFNETNRNEPNWYYYDKNNLYGAMIGYDGAYFNLEFTDLDEMYDRVKGISLNTSKEIESSYSVYKEIVSFVQLVDIGDYVVPQITKVFMFDEDDVLYQIDKDVIFFNDEKTSTIDIIDYFNKNYFNRYDFSGDGSLLAKELEYF